MVVAINAIKQLTCLRIKKMSDLEKQKELYEALQLAHWEENWDEYNRLVAVLKGENK